MFRFEFDSLLVDGAITVAAASTGIEMQPLDNELEARRAQELEATSINLGRQGTAKERSSSIARKALASIVVR